MVPATGSWGALRGLDAAILCGGAQEAPASFSHTGQQKLWGIKGGLQDPGLLGPLGSPEGMARAMQEPL